LEHLLFGGKKSRRARKRERAGVAQDTAASSSEQNANLEYVLDPITNRKVFQNIVQNTYSASDKGVDIPVPDAHPYRPQFTPFKAPEVKDLQEPIFYDGPPPEAELKMYGQVKIDASPWDSISQHTPNGRKRPAVGHECATGSGLLGALSSEHKDVFWHHHDGIASSSGASTAISWTYRPRAPEYSDLHKYRTVIDNDEPSSDEPAKQDYEDLHNYTAVRYQEPDGKPSESEPVQKHEDLGKYGAVRSHEPDGKYKTKLDRLVESQELNKYGAFRSHEPDGKYAANYAEAKPDTEEQESTPKYDDLGKYGAVRSCEPDGKYKMEQASTQKYDDLDKYGAVRSHEPDGKYKLEPELPVDPEELSKYGAFRSHEPDGKYAINHAAPEPDAAELAQYSKPFLSHEPDGKYAASYMEPKYDEAELGQYKAFRSQEPDGKYASNHAEPKTDSAELGTYGAFRSHEPDGKYAADNTTPAADSPECHQYQAFRSHEPDGKYAAEAEAATESPDLGNHEAFSYDDSETRPSQDTQPSRNAPDLEGYRKVQIDEPHKSSAAEEGYDPAELKQYQPLRWNEPDGKPSDMETADQTLFEYDLKGEMSSEDQQEKTPFRKVVDELMAKSAAESEGVIQPSLERVNKSKARAASSTVEHDQTGPATQPSAHTSLPTPPPTPTQPSLYKVLVYDPTMQHVEVAETTSIVPDSAVPLSPAEVLLRISNPAKFFPHFAPLQAQGFEIVSGGGDVLIFRKVREAAEVQKYQQASSATSATTPVNPIDMTGGRRDYTVAADRFASPTGFVNYDLPPASTVASRVQAESAVHHEEPAIGGQKVGEDKPTKKRVTKRVAVGAAWLAGVSYSLGVVSEYFKTGGSDGTGPKGF
jgi:hypothetical protein